VPALDNIGMLLMALLLAGSGLLAWRRGA